MNKHHLEVVENRPPWLGHRQRLRERFQKSGLDGFAEYEIVELLLTLVIPRSDVKSRAKALIAKFSSLRGILDAPEAELRKIDGIGRVTPTALQIVKAVASLYLLQGCEGMVLLSDSSQIAEFWRARIGGLSNEVFQVAYLDAGYRLLREGVETIEEGTTDRATVYPRRVIEAALLRGATAIMLAHNHPNGKVSPSEQDKTLTRAIVLAAETVGIRVVDHLIVSASDCFSFRKAGMM